MTESSSPLDPEYWAARLVNEVEPVTVENATLFFRDAMHAAESKGYAAALSDHDSLKADAARANESVKPLASYQYGDVVEVYHQGQWVPGRVHSNDPATRLLIVDTESGPRTLNSTRAIRPAQA